MGNVEGCPSWCCCCGKKDESLDTEIVSKSKKGGKDDLSEETKPSTHQVIIEEEEKNPFKDLETRLEKRDMTFCDDGAMARAIKTNDLKKLEWMVDRGFPLNLNVKDADGMCYEAVDMADHFSNKPDIQKFVRELAAKGHPRQTVIIQHGDKEAEIIMANSTEDFRQFRGNICHVFGIDKNKTLYIHAKGDDDHEDMKWNKMREGKTYIVQAA